MDIGGGPVHEGFAMRLALQDQIRGREVTGGMFIELPDGLYAGHLARVANIDRPFTYPHQDILVLNVDCLDSKVGRIAYSLNADQPVFQYGQVANAVLKTNMDSADEDWFNSLAPSADDDDAQ